MGLWDSVAQFGVNGGGNGYWQLAIPPEAKNVFHAVALNEHRPLFPGESIGRGIQRGFIGSHADVGGAYGTGDLSDVALNWIYDQAVASGLKMKTWREVGQQAWGTVSNPVLHDKSSLHPRRPDDRDFCLRQNNEIWADICHEQRSAAPGGMTWRDSVKGSFIRQYPKSVMDADGSSRIVGEIDMKQYAAWLKLHYGTSIALSAR